MAAYTFKVLLDKNEAIHHIIRMPSREDMLHDLRVEVAHRKQKIEQTSLKFSYVGLLYVDQHGDKVEMTSNDDLLGALHNSVVTVEGVLKIEAVFGKEKQQPSHDDTRKKLVKPKKPNGLQQPKPISSALSRFLGCQEISRLQAVSLLNKYIKDNDLQNPDNKREIINDKALIDLFGVPSMTHFSMNKHLSPHFYSGEGSQLDPKPDFLSSGVKRPTVTTTETKTHKKKPKKSTTTTNDTKKYITTSNKTQSRPTSGNIMDV